MVWLFLLMSVLTSCERVHQKTMQKVSVRKHTVTSAPIHLPPRIAESAHGRTIVSPSVWNQKTISFSEGMPQTITVRRGESVYTVSRRYGVPIPAIITRNSLRPPYTLKIGQKLILMSPRVHIVQKGEDAYQIAQQHGVSPTRLLVQNDLTSTRVKVGQVIVLPEPPAPIIVPPKAHTLPRVVTARQLRSTTLPTRSSHGFRRPVAGPVVMAFGRHGHGVYCDGINIRVPIGTRVQAADHGVVAYVGKDIKSYGNLVLIKHAGGWVTAYAHLKDTSVRKGDTVRQGQMVGRSGDTGYVRSPQLHFEIRKNGRPINPRQLGIADTL